MHSNTYNWRGVVIFGPPGSGKSTLAKNLAKKLPGSFCLEASQDIITPLAALPVIPKTATTLLRFFHTFQKQKRRLLSLPRNTARKLFSLLQTRYGKSAIGNIIAAIHGNEPSIFLIASGLRGYDNTRFLKQHGYYVVYLDAGSKTLTRRLVNRMKGSYAETRQDLSKEQRLYQTDHIEAVAHTVFNTEKMKPPVIAKMVSDAVRYRECRICINSNRNPSILIGNSGLCAVCERYSQYFDKKLLAREMEFFKSFVGKGRGKYDIMVGISGGKDSSAMLRMLQKRGFRILAFSFDIGYYPRSIFLRAKEVAERLGIDYIKIDIRKYARAVDRKSFALMADLYDEKPSEELKNKFRELYEKGRKHYSAKCRHALPFVRSCQLCRRLVIRAYYAEAAKRKIPMVILGLNEWAQLSQGENKPRFSAIRKLKPFVRRPAVYIAHSPFLFQRKAADTRKILRKMGWWKLPAGERLIESNANSCLLARAAEKKAMKMLGFHPDSTRLAREITAGFITKDQARKAINKIHYSKYTVRSILKRAHLLA